MPESGRLLILDDDITVGQAVASTAERFGFAVAVTSSAKEFFDAVGQWEPSSFVAQMRTSREARKIVESTTALSRKLGLTIVAEGVEDGPTLGLLEEAGCDFAQGYFISRPMPGDAVRPWLRRYAAHPSIHSS